MKKNTSFIFLLLIIMAAAGRNSLASSENLPAPFKVVPQPHKVELLQGPGLAYNALESIQIKGVFQRPVMPPLLNSLPNNKKAAKGILLLILSEDRSLPESEEGYILHIENENAVISARGEAGLFYGCQTLGQLLEDAQDTGVSIPSCKITDYPSLSYRAIHIDVKHHLDTMKYYYDSIDRLARYKINAIIFEFEDKLRFKRRPLIGAPQAISIDEMAALTRYARCRHIEISPLVQGLGHATFILKHENFAPLREDPESRWAFCPMDEGTYEVLFDLYLDAFDATPGSRYLHVGGDEVGEIGHCSRCRTTGENEGKLALYLYWLNRVCDFAQKHNRIPIFWDDMIFKYAGVWETMWSDFDHEKVAQLWEKGVPILDSVLEKYPKNCVFMRWNYTLGRQKGNIRALGWLKKQRLQAMIATAAQNVHPLLPQTDRVDIIQSFINVAEENDINGMLCTAWDDSSPHMETYWRGLIASAEFSWNPKGRSLEEYEKAFLQREFGPECEEATWLYAELFEAVSFWNRALCHEGNRRRGAKLLDLPDHQNPGRWTKKYEKRLQMAHKETERYVRLKAKLKELKKKALRNRYHLTLLSAINDFQITSAHMLLALKDCDTADSKRGDNCKKKIYEIRKNFDHAWERLKKAYRRTRFISYPDNYVKDRYFHLASKSEDLTWMIEVDNEFHKLVEGWFLLPDSKLDCNLGMDCSRIK